MEECGHQTCETPYCPYCGVYVSADPLDALEQHIRTHVDNASKRRTGWLARLETAGTGTATSRAIGERLERDTRILDKWAPWLASLLELRENFDRLERRFHVMQERCKEAA